VKARGGSVSHLDVAIVCEAPKVNPHRDAMRARIAEIAGLSLDRVGVKATTNEKLGALGKEEGIAAYATATIRLPWSAP
jgi:2-C-methyl-D-erythritol 4-phosphate cytidylyltransferase/2-C-methyl-D-erythritol 2,4-cyclodiphosphate synthase